MEAGSQTTVSIERALKIDGWMSEPELLWLAEQAQKHYEILEIGSHLGRSTIALAQNTEGRVLAFDDWFGPRDVARVWDSNKLFQEFCENVKGYRVQKLKGNHADIEILLCDPLLRNMRFDMVFIDGSHEYADVKRDIQAAKKHCNGLICGHDFWWPGVQKAVGEEFDFVGVAESIWYKEQK